MTNAGMSFQDQKGYLIESFGHQAAPALANQSAGLVDSNARAVFPAVLEAKQTQKSQPGGCFDRASRVKDSKYATFIMYHV